MSGLTSSVHRTLDGQARRVARAVISRTVARRAGRLAMFPSTSCVVFAPHADDETLGMGGTILTKTRAGARVKVVVVTDGALSHPRLMERARLTALREREAIAACGRLGVPADAVEFLRFPDGELDRHHDAAVQAARDVVAAERPDEVYVPYRFDGHDVHEHTNRVVVDAVAAARSRAAIYEYPVWFWYRWPFVPMAREHFFSRRPLLRVALDGTVRLLGDFRWAVPLEGVRAHKRAALDEYATQMTRIDGNPRWPIMSDVAGGEFLDCFFGESELFARRRP